MAATGSGRGRFNLRQVGEEFLNVAELVPTMITMKLMALVNHVGMQKLARAHENVQKAARAATKLTARKRHQGAKGRGNVKYKCVY